MAEGKKSKVKAHAEAARLENISVGDMLRTARTAKGLELEEVSASIHIRATQLRAIEENNIDALPGMTYAVGFVRSYANFLGLNGTEVVHKFKSEHGHTPAPSKLVFPEPIVESRMPDPIMVGIGAFLAILVLVIWAIYSNMHGSSKVVEQIPPAPAVTTTADIPAPAETPAPAASPAAPATTAAPATPVVSAPAAKTAAPVAAAAPAQTETDNASPEEDSDAPPAIEGPMDKSLMPDAAAGENKTDQEPVINIKHGKSRITLKALQSSWIQIMNAQQDVIYRKVLRPGEQYYVPDQAGLSLVTANAGGLQVLVDGQPVQDLGKPGEIVRGVILDPATLKVHRTRVRN